MPCSRSVLQLQRANKQQIPHTILPWKVKFKGAVSVLGHFYASKTLYVCVTRQKIELNKISDDKSII